MRKSLFVSFLAILFIQSGLFAQKKQKENADTVNSAYFKSLKWRNIGPFRGGRTATVTGVEGKPNLYYFGGCGGGVWRTTDAGNTWENISDSSFGGSIGAVAVSSSDNNVIYVGQGEETVRGNVSSGFGVWKSVDAGKTWKHMGLEGTKNISRIRINPDNPDIAYVAALGDPFKDSEDRGVFKTTDGGKSWKKMLYADAGSGAADLMMDPGNPRILYASTWTFRRTPYSFSSGGKGSKLWKSTDEGETWTDLTTKEGFPKGLLGMIGVTVSPADPERVWALVENEPHGGLYRSDDGGDKWHLVNSSRDIRQRAWYFSKIYADTKDRDKIYIMNVDYFVSNDGGKTLSKHDAPHGDHHDLWIAPENPERMIIGDDGGAQISFDAGQNWSSLMNQPTGQFYRIISDDHFPYRIYGAQQDNTSIRILSRSSEPFISERDWEITAGGEAGHHAVEKNNEVVFGGEYGGIMIRLDHRNNATQMTDVWPDSPLGHGVKDMKYRFQWNYPMFISPFHPDQLYAFSNHVHISTDEGRSWKTISPDLTTNDTTKQKASGGPITKDNSAVEYYCTIFAAVPSALKDSIIWTGSDDGLVYITKDAGNSWTNVTPKDIPAFTQINSMDADPFHAGGLYLAGTRYKWGDDSPYLYYTSDYGNTWTRIDNGIKSPDFTRVIRADPNREGLLYAGTEYGLYISFNNGKYWQPFRNKLPITPITDLRVKDRELVAATQGRGIWILDDLNPLYEMNYNWDPDAYLFKPSPTWMMTSAYGGKSKTKGENRPDGAIINYYLKTVDTSANTYELRFLDKSGKQLVSYSSKADKKEYKWVPKKGGDRFIWDLRTEAVDTVPGTVLWWAQTDGPQVVPGNYQVQLIVNKDTLKAPFETKIDPLLDVSQGDLQAQFDFLMDIHDNLNKLNKAIKEIRSSRTQLNGIKKTVKDSTLLAEMKDILSKGKTIEETLYQTKAKSNEDVLNFPVRLENKYGYLGAIADYGFNRPTRQMYETKKEFDKDILKQIDDWAKVKAQIAKLNTDLNNAKIPYVDFSEK